jgi:hypothetical protein
MAQASQADLPTWLKWRALPVRLFAMVALSNLTPQNNGLNNDLEISNTAYIRKKALEAQNGLPEYHHYMDTTSENFEGAYRHLLEGHGGHPFSDLYVVVLVRRKVTSALAGCFFFGFAPSQNTGASSSFVGRLVFQRLYPSIGVKASHWYQCLYAALFQEVLYKGHSLSRHLLSAGLLPEVRKAPGTVRSLPLYGCFLACDAGA